MQLGKLRYLRVILLDTLAFYTAANPGVQFLFLGTDWL